MRYKWAKPDFMAILMVLLIISSAPSLSRGQNEGDITFQYSLRTDLSAPMPPPYLRKGETGYYDYMGRKNLIYHGMKLIGSFKMGNNSLDTVKLALDNELVSSHLRLEFSQDRFATQINPIKASFTTITKEGDFYKGNLISPMDYMEISVVCEWVDIAKIDSDTVLFRYTFDNSDAAIYDNRVIPIRQSTDFVRFKIIPLKTKLDSINYLDMQAQNMYARDDLQGSITMSLEMLRLDSTNFNPYYTITVALWKMNQFDEAIVWAQKAADIIKWWREFGNYYVTSDNGEYYLLMQRIINKCHGREKWDPTVVTIY